MINSISQLLLLYGGTYGTIENILHQVDNTESYKNMSRAEIFLNLVIKIKMELKQKKIKSK